MLKNQAGITLVALVVTIIILVILATISISIALNTDLIGKAETSSQLYSNATEEEIDILQNSVYVIDQRLNAVAATAATH